MTRRALILLLVAAALPGCGRLLEPPPVEVGFRESLVGAGRIVRLRNTSDRELTGLRIEIRAPDGDERSLRRDRLEPFEVFELGWKKLGGWEIPPGARVTVSVDGHLRSARAVLPAS